MHHQFACAIRPDSYNRENVNKTQKCMLLCILPSLYHIACEKLENFVVPKLASLPIDDIPCERYAFTIVTEYIPYFLLCNTKMDYVLAIPQRSKYSERKIMLKGATDRVAHTELYSACRKFKHSLE